MARARLVLSHVCTSWRMLALHIPELWSHINVGQLKQPQHYECLKTWLHRSPGPTIHGSISDDLEGVDEFGSMVLSNIHRCRRLTMHVTPTLLPMLLCLPPGSLRALVSANLHFSMHKFGRELRGLAVDTPITAFQMAPQLRCVMLKSIQCDKSMADLRYLHLPLPQLTTLALEGMKLAVDSCIAMLHACAALESCRVSVASIGDLAFKGIHAHTAPAVVLPALHTLHLSGDVFHATFLAAFHLPSLRSLDLSGTTIKKWSVGILTPILVPAAHTLQVLHSGNASCYISFNMNVPGQDVHALLELLPHLTTCIVDTSVCWNRDALNAVRDGTCGMQLETLGIGIVSVAELLDVTEGQLCALQKSMGTISVISVLRGVCLPPPDMEHVEALHSAGVQVYFDFDLSYRSGVELAGSLS
ncbi:hypothetical protein BD779DRAFT_1772721 [Infundibulicybe gibba]|nr:hypothetical protein BD779DRAFT_1772721 [Infundibulicybe gibba]